MGAEDDPINDPVYQQPQGQSSKGTQSDLPNSSPDSAASQQGSNDPVYQQEQADSSSYKPEQPSPPLNADAVNNSMNDPVYQQPQAQQQPSSGDLTSSSPSSSLQQGSNDPVYQQIQADKNFDSPTTPEPQSAASAQGSNDPVYQQLQADNSPSVATSRLQQVASHISPQHASNTKRPRRKRKTDEHTLPADYSDIIAHIDNMKKIANTPDLSNRGYSRQKQGGKLWARERIEQLLDPGSWHEVGSVAGTTQWRQDTHNPQAEHVASFIPSNNPQGFGTITCPTGTTRKVFLTADDFSIRSGHADGSTVGKTLYGEKLALRLMIPVVKLVDGSSGGGSVTTIKSQGYAYLPHVNVLSTVVKQLNVGIPNLGAVVGPAIGLGAARVVSTHFSVMAGNIGSMFNAGPKVVEGATFEEGLSFSDLGGPMVHCTNGTIDNLADDEAGCFEQIRTVLGYLPDCGAIQAPPVVECSDDVNREDIGLRSIVPRKKSRMYNPYTIIESVVDRGSWFEIGRLWGRTSISGLARLGGRPVGVLSLNCEVNGGALDTGGSQKLMKMIKLCDVFNLPILQFLDVPGYAIGTVAERTATMKWGVELAKAYYATTTPIFSVVTRRCYGVAGGIMLDSRDPIMRVAWPSANWGSLPLEGGIEVAHRHELKQVAEKEGEERMKRRYKELEDEYLRMMNPVRSANAFNIEEIVDPKDTRKIVCAWAQEMYGKVMQQRLADRAAGRLVAIYT